VLDRLIAPWGLIGLALLVLARVERNAALLLFTVGYLALVLLVLPTSEGMSPPGWAIPSFLSGAGSRLRLSMTPPQLITGALLLAGGIGFSRARRRQR